MQQKNIHWFPGHMKKALDEIEQRLKIVDVIIEIVDARAPLSSRNRHLYKLTEQKKRLIVVSKGDLADLKQTNVLLLHLKKDNNSIVLLNLNDNKAINVISKEVFDLGKEKREKELKKGMKPQPIRAMIIGIPNVGKSTLINRLSKRNAASVQNTPGHTKAQQWIKVNKDFELLDTPGVLPPNYDDSLTSMHLSLIGSIKDNILPLDELCSYLYDFLNVNYKDTLKNRYGDSNNINEMLENIAQKRGYMSGGVPNIDKSYITFLKEFREGKLGLVTLDRIDKNA